MNKKIYKSKFLVISLIYFIILLITIDARPAKICSDLDEEFSPLVKAKESGEYIQKVQKDRLERFKRSIEEGKRLFNEEMDYEGAIRKFKEASSDAVTTKQKSDVFFYLSLVYYSTIEVRGVEEFNEAIRKLIEIDYYREPDKLLCPPKYIELFQIIKKEYGVLRVQSKPMGADVFIENDKYPMGKTPLTIVLKAGTVKVRVRKGKKEKEDVINVISEKEITSPIYILKKGTGLMYVLGAIVLAGGVGAAVLLKSKEEGSTSSRIIVNSTPIGARVYLDETDTRQVTNCILDNISPGNHAIKLIKEGYIDYQENVSVTAGQTTTLNATLTMHTITVTDPTSSTIWRRGQIVEIKWQTDGSARIQGNIGLRAGLNLQPYPDRQFSSTFQKNNFQYKLFYREASKTRKGLEDAFSSKNRVTILDESSKFQNRSEKSSSVEALHTKPLTHSSNLRASIDTFRTNSHLSMGKLKWTPSFGQFRGLLKVHWGPASCGHFIHFDPEKPFFEESPKKQLHHLPHN